MSPNQLMKTATELASTSGLVMGIFGIPVLVSLGWTPMALSVPSAMTFDLADDRAPVAIEFALHNDRSNPLGKSEVSKPTEPEVPVVEEQESEKAAPTLAVVTPKTPTRVEKAAPAPTLRPKLAFNRGTPDGLRNVAARAEKRTKTSAAQRKKNRRCQKPTAGIGHVFGDRYSVDRSVMERFLTIEEALKLARVSWHRNAKGKVDGFRLHRVACGSPLTQVGLQNGDVIHDINGRQVRSLPEALIAVRKVKRHDAIKVNISRNGKRMTRLVSVR